MLLKDKVGIVSGVGPGLGKEIALAFAREGADLVLGARTESYLAEVQTEIEGLGRRARYAPTDITDQAQCDRSGADRDRRVRPSRRARQQRVRP